MDGKYNELELLFIERALELHGERLCDLLHEQVTRKKLIKSSDLLDSIRFTVGKYGIDPVLLVSFISYGRAIEIAWHKKSRNSQLFAKPNTNVMLWGVYANRKKIRRKDTKWYAKTAYGSINRLIAVLASDFTEAERKHLKQILEIRHESQG